MTMLPRPRRDRRRAARLVGTAFLAGAVALTPAATASAASASDPSTSAPITVNPFDLAGGFSVYARQDATLANQETEGSIAVGGELTVTRSGGGTYAIHHYVAGTPGYTIPTVDGDPTRLLVGSYSTDSGLVEIKNSGSGGDPALAGHLKVAHDSTDFAAFERGGWVRWRTATDDAPAIDATNQPWPAGQETVRTERDDVASYVEAGATPFETVQRCLADLGSPTGAGHQVGVAGSWGERYVLEPLSAVAPNVVDYADVAGAGLLQLSDGSAAPGPTNPLIVRVPAGTTDLTGFRMDPQGTYSPYILWDLSAVTGPVSLTSPVRIDGSVYAPAADLTVSASPLDGQVVARNLVLAGEGEAHAFLFAGTIPCGGDPVPTPTGGYAVTKVVDDRKADVVPTGTTFTVEQTLDGVAADPLTLRADERQVVDGLPVGTQVELTEVALPEIEGVRWGEPRWTGDGVRVGPDGSATFVVGDGTIVELVLTNTADGTPGPWVPTDPTDPIDPGTIDPGTTDPGTTDPGTTDPDTTDLTDPSDPGAVDPTGTPAPTAAARRPSTSGALATTGAATVAPVAVAAALVLAGAVVLALRRRAR
ncbi:collagen-binding domain-containing protein [Cellulosimicrobium sp. Marseille-Q4280]|uniref:collagen-binding domain-containing protein n=1 Tax=Cellulosimicrobium sp. Marseille-Q4280 TaxID=2937992 RepID=UPI0020412953|nr:collagen-binding domain-containing protein [Cellulosimicrobium sp. Marseille-Q4280]